LALLQIGKRRYRQKLLHPRGRLYLSVSSEGLGHSSRALAMAKHFQRDEVLIGSYGYALQRIQGEGYRCLEIPQEYKFVGEDGTFDVGKTLIENHRSPLELNDMVQHEMQIMKTYGISLVVADGRIAPVLAAGRLGIPCVVVTNQSAFYPFFEKDSPLVQLFGRSFDWVMRFWLSSAEEILIPDLPPPYTVCLPSLSDNFQVKKRTRFVGPMLSWNPKHVRPLIRSSKAPFIVVSLGGHRFRKPLFDAVLRTAAHLPEFQFCILTSFRAESVPDNVTVREMVSDSSAYFKAADLIISPAGHSTAMELLALGIPSILVPDARQAEQGNNADRMVELGVAKQLSYDELHPVLLRQTIESVLWSPTYREKALQMAAIAGEWDGSEVASDVLREYAHRLVAY
jgi:UDP-N-acetylglucosamine--N-acetylmuramyl-(pentapeptide) pyrophosphoryl-undecaprenol N-acetylglucosamine transferase